MSESINELAAALAKAQTEMQNPGFDSTNPHFRNKFASLAAVRNAVVPIFAKHGIFVSQDLTSLETGVSCVTILTHASGQQMRFGPLVLPVAKNDAQGFGSAATYCRRYSLMAVACVVGDDDDDANAATGKPAGAEIHSPKGDLGKNVPASTAQTHVDHMLKLMAADNPDGDHDERLKALTILDYHEDVLNADPDLYVAVGDKLPAAKRNAWKAYVSQGKKYQHETVGGR
jgi:ERF superfamily